MARGRKPGPEKTKVHLNIRADILAQVQAVLPKDILTGRTEYGQLSSLVEKLLVEYLEKNVELRTYVPR